jgi:hypothetical protein
MAPCNDTIDVSQHVVMRARPSEAIDNLRREDYQLSPGFGFDPMGVGTCLPHLLVRQQDMSHNENNCNY